MALGEALGGIVGGFLGKNAAKMDRRHQKDMMNKAMAAFDKLGFPPDLSKQLIVEELQRQGQYTPELEETIDVVESEYNQIKEDPSLQKAQLQALGGLQERAKVGLSAEDRAGLNQVRQEVQRDAEGKRQQILQQMQARGMGGSGAELIAQLQAGQSGAELASQQSDNLMAQAQQRALQALGQSGQMAGDMQQAKFGREADVARALDERNRFLAENTIARQQRNVGSLNQAQAANLAEQQRLHEANITNRRAEAERQVAAKGNQYNQGLSYAQGKAGQAMNMANFYGQQAQQKADAQVAMGKGVGGLADAGVGAAFGSPGSAVTAGGATTTTGASSGYGEMAKKFGFSDEDTKEDINYDDAEVQSFMDRISKKFRT